MKARFKTRPAPVGTGRPVTPPTAPAKPAGPAKQAQAATGTAKG